MLRTRKRKVAFGLGLLGLLAAIGLVIAQFLVRGPVGGGGSIDAVPPEDVSVTVHEITSQSGAQCSGVGTSNVTINGQRGGRCNITLAIDNPNQPEHDLVYQDFRWAEDFVATRFIAFGQGSARCGSDIDGTNGRFAIEFRIRDDGGVQQIDFTADPAIDGVVIVSADDYVDSECPR